MRIAMLGSFPADPHEVPGGVEAVIRNLATELARLPDTDVHIVTNVPGAAESRRQEYAGLTVHYVPGQASLGNLTLHRRDRRNLAAAARALQPDIVHGHGTDVRAAASLDTGLPGVVTVHGILYKEVLLGRGPRALLRRRVMADLERKVLRQARDIVVIARYVEDAVAHLTRARFHRLANPVDRRYFDLPTSDDGRTILSVATVQPRKGQHVLVEAFARIRAAFPDARLRLLGKVVFADYGERVRRAIADHGLQDAVTLEGFQPDAVLERAFCECAAFTLGSVEESSPVSIAEAMTLGKPVVATRVGGVPDLVSHGMTGYVVDHGDVAATAEAFARILGDDAHRRQLGQAGRERAHRDFHPEAIARKTRELYARIIEENGAS